MAKAQLQKSTPDLRQDGSALCAHRVGIYTRRTYTKDSQASEQDVQKFMQSATATATCSGLGTSEAQHR
ncbi:hypothetical protein PRZ48_008818 [Zasmidium cellare]|uniref:Uncharacterized protein n=1 Tax=Zasmidium cellare TaxID=395010 RepID=A0ABR0EGJ0_ZASCE|nr:hypothetical protein PRZ48_008818 [Zasmidium cellare]